MNKFWEKEPDETIKTSSVVIRFWESEKKIIFSKPDWTDKDGNIQHGKGIVVDIASFLKENTDLLEEIGDFFNKITAILYDEFNERVEDTEE